VGRADAVKLTEVIREALVEADASALRAARLLVQAKEVGAWRAMGYQSFTEYVYSEFKIKRTTAWKWVTQILVSGDITEAAHLTWESEPVIFTQREAQKLRPRLPVLTKDIAAATAEAPPSERAAIVADIVRPYLGTQLPAACNGQDVHLEIPPGYGVCTHCEGTGVVPLAVAAVSY